jgi:hypothetical protein
MCLPGGQVSRKEAEPTGELGLYLQLCPSVMKVWKIKVKNNV